MISGSLTPEHHIDFHAVSGVLGLGALGAALSVALNLAGLKPAGVRFSLTVAQGLNKIVLGAITAVLGIIVLRTVTNAPGFLATQAGLMTTAVVFGYSQQLFTRLIDRQANQLMNAASPTTPAAQLSAARQRGAPGLVRRARAPRDRPSGEGSYRNGITDRCGRAQYEECSVAASPEGSRRPTAGYVPSLASPVPLLAGHAMPLGSRARLTVSRVPPLAKPGPAGPDPGAADTGPALLDADVGAVARCHPFAIGRRRAG